jgi:hypothetical protein
MTVDEKFREILIEECPDCDFATVSYLANYVAFDCDWSYIVTTKIEFVGFYDDCGMETNPYVEKTLRAFCSLYNTLKNSYGEGTLTHLATCLYLVKSTERKYKSCRELAHAIQYLRTLKLNNPELDFSWRIGVKPAETQNCLEILNAFASFPRKEIMSTCDYVKFG